jgi:hypothetical protein
MVVILQSSFCVINVECFQQAEVLAYPILHIQVMCDASSAGTFASHSLSAAIKILYTNRLVPHLHLESRIRMNTTTPPLPHMLSWQNWDKHTFHLPIRDIYFYMRGLKKYTIQSYMLIIFSKMH